MTGYKKKYYRLIDELKNNLIEYYGERLMSIILFGSVGRNRFHPDSDIDILIIIKDAPKGRSNRFFEYYDNIYLKLEKEIRFLLKEGINILISPVIKTKQEAEYGSPLFIEMADECKILYDEKDFFKSILEKLRAKMKEYKSEKVYYKGKYYWRLKPDYKWGEEIVL